MKLIDVNVLLYAAIPEIPEHKSASASYSAERQRDYARFPGLRWRHPFEGP